MSARVLVVGSYNQDHIWNLTDFPASGETVLGEDFASGAGGKGFNQAVAAARQGAETCFIGACGNDATGELAQANAREAGITAHWQVIDDEATGTAAILVEAGGHNRIIVAPGANARLSADFIAAQDSAFTPDSVLLLQLETNHAAVRRALDLAARHGTRTILNPAPFDATLAAETLARCDMLTPNENEFAQLMRQHANTSLEAGDIAAMADAELATLCRRLPVASIVITLGAHGCFVAHGDASRFRDEAACYRLSAEQVDAIDTTGAGDAFNGALAAALVRQPDAMLASCVRQAGRAAALSTERRGAAASMASLDETNARFGDI